MSDHIWINVPPLGAISIEKVLVTFDVPELFVCKAENKKRYLAVYEDNGPYQYLLAATTPFMLLNMFSQDISIDAMFLENPDKQIYRLFLGDEESPEFRVDSVEQLSQEELPDQGTLFTLQNKSIEQYRHSLERELSKQLNSKPITQMIGHIQQIYTVPDYSSCIVKRVNRQRQTLHTIFHQSPSPSQTVSAYGSQYAKSVARQEVRHDGKKQTSVLKPSTNKTELRVKSGVSTI